jgi:hypothetical protein
MRALRQIALDLVCRKKTASKAYEPEWIRDPITGDAVRTGRRGDPDLPPQEPYYLKLPGWAKSDKGSRKAGRAYFARNRDKALDALGQKEKR